MQALHLPNVTKNICKENEIMPIKILLITHEEIGTALLQATHNAFGGELPLATTVISVQQKTDPDTLLLRLKQFLNQIDISEGVLILTDLYGSTPCNIASQLNNQEQIQVVSGLNLPMLIRVMNYPSLSLVELANKALSGGKDGVLNCSKEQL